MREIHFIYGVMKRCDKDMWGLFTPTPLNQPSYVFFIRRYKDTFLNIPTWTRGAIGREHYKEMVFIPFEECFQLALDNDISCANSEWF